MSGIAREIGTGTKKSSATKVVAATGRIAKFVMGGKS
jgi:hypothetical protein